MSVLPAWAVARETQRYQAGTWLERMTPAERTARGKEARAAAPRDSHAVSDPGRAEPIGLLEEQAKANLPGPPGLAVSQAITGRGGGSKNRVSRLLVRPGRQGGLTSMAMRGRRLQ